jgi:hypothetical protein
MDKLLEEFIKDWRLKNNSKDAIYSSYHYDAMIEFAKHYHSQQLILSGVSESFKTELEMHEIATEKYQEHNFGDAKYDGFMDCYRMLVKETKNNTSLSK